MTEKPTVLVVGVGSIGRRHAQLLTEAGADVLLADVDEARVAAVAESLGVRAERMTPDSGIPSGLAPDGVVIASPTSLHSDHVDQALAVGALVLVEKPIATTAAAAQLIASHGSDRVAVAHNLRFHAPVERTRRLVAERAGTISAVRIWFGSWLPDWRPGTDYRDSYSAQAALGGGVLLDAIHELDLLLMLLGPGPYDVRGATVARLGALDIDVEDTVHATICAPSGTVAHIALDYLARRYRRGIEVTGSDATVRLDWARGVIEVEDADAVASEPAVTPVGESYVRQIAAFLAWIDGGPPMPVDAATGAESVLLAEQIRAAAR